MRSRYLLLAAVLTIGVGLDQWTKWWADRALGTVQHPLPVHIVAAEDGLPLGEVLRDRFGLSEAELDAIVDRGLAGLAILYKDLRPGAAEPAFPRRGLGRPTWYWAFHHRSLDRPPRRLPKARSRDRDIEDFGDSTVEGYLAGVLPYLSDDARAELIEGYLFGAVHGRVSLDRRVVAGESYLLLHRPVSVIDGFLQFRYAENPGAVWGIFSEQSQVLRKWFFFIVSLVAMGVMGTLFYRLDDVQKLPAWGLAVILSGAIGNFIDRLRFNYVIDFIDMYVGESHWPTYNVADIAIVIGLALLLADLAKRRDEAFLMNPGNIPKEEPQAG